MPVSDRLTPPPFKHPVAATRIYDRIPEWKYHTSIGLAKNAIAYSVDYNHVTRESYAREGEIWTYINGVWELQYVIEKHCRVEDLSWRKKHR